MEIFKSDFTKSLKLPLVLSNVAAGFPSPAEDFEEHKLDLNELIVKHPVSTFFVRVKGESMKDAGIAPGDILVVDRSIEPSNDAIIIAIIDNEFTVKRLKKTKNEIYLLAENENFRPIRDKFEVWGVVTFAIKKFS